MRHGLFAVCAALLLAGCGALTAVTDATEPLDAFTLSPVRPAAVKSGTRHLVVPAAAATGALATDRILIKPNPLQAEYLPAGRWVDPAPVLIQSLLIASLQTGAGFRLVSRDDAGLTPDFTLLLDLTDFQAEAPETPGGPWLVRAAMVTTVIRDDDRSILATRRFEATASAATGDTAVIVNGFDAAVAKLLKETTAWIVRQTR